jgi:hypothetical protein
MTRTVSIWAVLLACCVAPLVFHYQTRDEEATSLPAEQIDTEIVAGSRGFHDGTHDQIDRRGMRRSPGQRWRGQ